MIFEEYNYKYKEFIQKKLSYFTEITFSIEEDKTFSVKRALEESTEVFFTDKTKIFSLDMDIFYKGLCSEIIGFNKRVEKQLLNVKKLNDEFDYTWNFVSEYYLSFFLVTTLTRFNNKFSVFLSSEEAGKLSHIATEREKEILQINPGQYVLTIDSKDYEMKVVTIRLEPKRDTHVTAWDLFSIFLKDYKNSDNSNTTLEDNLLASLEQFFQQRNNILSICRNEMNYKYHFGYEKVSQFKLYNDINWSSDFSSIQDKLLKLPHTPNMQECVNNIVVINYFLTELLKTIYHDFEKKLGLS